MCFLFVIPDQIFFWVIYNILSDLQDDSLNFVIMMYFY